jgi:L-iditol 2-dehydrogenase
MKAALLTGIRQFEIRQIPEPVINRDTSVLIRIKMVGVCGSDIHYFTAGRIGNQVVQFPFIIGHEAAGIVEQTGKKVSRVKPGQRIAIDPAVFCGECDQCQAGRENTCRNLLFLGSPGQLDGALSEFIVLNENCCYPIKEKTTYEQAVLSEPLAIAVYSIEQSRLPANAHVAILGAGPIGMSLFQVLKANNINNIFIADKIPERMEYARKLNPKWCGNPDVINVVKGISDIEPLLMDGVFECSGDIYAYSLAIKLLKPGGIFTIVGIPENDYIPFPIHELRRKEITVINIRRQVHCTQKAIDLLESGQINLDAMITHHFPLGETFQAFDLVANYRDGVMKAMISLD